MRNQYMYYSLKKWQQHDSGDSQISNPLIPSLTLKNWATVLLMTIIFVIWRRRSKGSIF